jgi:hypothetical protein
VKWQITLHVLNNTLLSLQWSSEPAAKPATPDRPGPITEKVTPPQTAFGIQAGSAPDRVHKRTVIK